MTATTTTTTRSRNARKVLGSLGVIGAAAAVAGMGTFGSFTDSTTPLAATVSSGTISLDLTAVGGTATLPTMSATNFVPGDSMSRPVELVNSGDLGLGTVSLTSTATADNKLASDPVNGLQLAVDSCSVAWTPSTNAAGVTTYTCGPGKTTFVTGKAVSNAELVGAKSLAPRTTDHLLVTVTLPVGAGNEFQGLTNGLDIKFVGTQKTGTNR